MIEETGFYMLGSFNDCRVFMDEFISFLLSSLALLLENRLFLMSSSVEMLTDEVPLFIFP